MCILMYINTIRHTSRKFCYLDSDCVIVCSCCTEKVSPGLSELKHGRRDLGHGQTGSANSPQITCTGRLEICGYTRGVVVVVV